MSLVPEQDRFLGDVAKLIAHARDLGFTVTGGELFRTPEQQRLHLRAGRSKTMRSRHLRRLAIDLNFFVDAPGGGLSLCYDRETLQPLGDFWEGLDPANRWGGNWRSFRDTPHFERREGAAAASDEARRTGGRVAPLAEAVGRGRANRAEDVLTVQLLLNALAAAGGLSLAAPLAEDGLFGPRSEAAIRAAQAEAFGFARPDGVVSPGARTIRGLSAALPDGVSPLLLRLAFPHAAAQAAARFAEPLAACLEGCGAASPLRQAHFLAQVGHESGELRFTEEIASGDAYEGRADLGNTEPGDGRRFKGRGLIQLTGRANYARFGAALGRERELLAHPERVAEEPALCVGAAGWYWTERGLNALADADDLRGVTRRINGGLNGLAHRRALLDRAKALYGIA